MRGKQQRVNALLVQTFPGVRVVVDAPLQMERELALLRQASGAVANDALEAMLAGVGAYCHRAPMPAASNTALASWP